MASVPNVPSIVEAGFPGSVASNWFLMAGPAGLSARDRRPAAHAPGRRHGRADRARALGRHRHGLAGRPDARRRSRGFVAREAARWAPVVRASGAPVPAVQGATPLRSRRASTSEGSAPPGPARSRPARGRSQDRATPGPPITRSGPPVPRDVPPPRNPDRIARRRRRARAAARARAMRPGRPMVRRCSPIDIIFGVPPSRSSRSKAAMQ